MGDGRETRPTQVETTRRQTEESRERSGRQPCNRADDCLRQLGTALPINKMCASSGLLALASPIVFSYWEKASQTTNVAIQKITANNLLVGNKLETAGSRLAEVGDKR